MKYTSFNLTFIDILNMDSNKWRDKSAVKTEIYSIFSKDKESPY